LTIHESGARRDVPDAIAPDGSEIYFRVVDGARASLVEVVLRSGRTTRAVHHQTVEEVWYFLAGSGEVWLRSPDAAASETRSVVTDDVVVIPTGWDFQFRALGDTALRFLCVTVPPWPGGHEAIPVDDGGLGEPSL
jgi:mannose-6-phosphate isomerase-like protein (cupin superfamily)